MKVSRINLAVKLFDRISVQKYFHHIEIRQFQTYISFLCQISARVCLHQPIQVVFFFIFIFEKKLPYFCRLDSSLYLITKYENFFWYAHFYNDFKQILNIAGRNSITQLLIKTLSIFLITFFSLFSFLGQISARICLHQPLQGVYSGREPYRLHGHFLRIWSHVMSTGTFQSLDYRRPNTLALKPTDVSYFFFCWKNCTAA